MIFMFLAKLNIISYQLLSISYYLTIDKQKYIPKISICLEFKENPYKLNNIC